MEVAKVAVIVAGIVSVFALVYLIHAYTGNEDSKTYVTKGVKVERLKIPKTCGFIAGDGDKLIVQYRGTLENGKEFDSSYKRDKPFEFEIGAGVVIKGWEYGMNGMCIGEKRRLTIPPDMAYGEKGMPPVIPGGATLIFEIELVGMY